MGYATLMRWRLYAEEGLAGKEADLWLLENKLAVEHAGEPLSRYDLRLVRALRKRLPRSSTGDAVPAVEGRLTSAEGSAPVGLLSEPTYARRSLIEHRDMPVVRAQPQFRRGAAAREPLAVGGGYYTVPAAMQ